MAVAYDAAVVGGGPSGAFAAHGLAQAGRRVVLIDPGTTRPRLEGLGERVAHLLRLKGLERALEAAGEPVPRTVCWAGLNEPSTGERLVRRHLFDDLLRQEAAKAGAAWRRARLARLLSADPEKGVRLKLSSGEVLDARLMIDARGRHAPVRQSWARETRVGARRQGPQTLSISGLLDRPLERPGTHVEATPQGWLWEARDAAFGHWVQISIDSDDLPGAGQAALSERLRAFLAQPQFAGRFENCVLKGKLLARHSGLVLSAPELAPPVLPIGDAAVAIEPLSGHGMFWALSSALAAVPTVLTILEDAKDGAALAARFHRDRVVATFWRQARVGRDFYRLEENLAGHPFWAPRAAWPDDAPDDAASHPAVETVRRERRVVVAGNRLAEREVFVTPQDPDGVAFVCGLAVDDLLARLHRGDADIPPPARHWLRSRGLCGELPNRELSNPSDTAITRVRDSA